MTTTPPLRLGMIGAGRWSTAYARTAQSMPEVCRIVAVARQRPLPLEPPFAAIPVVTEWRDLITTAKVDGLIIATPPCVHAEPAIEAAQAGIAVLLEKPMTLDVTEARAIVAAVRERKIPAVVDHTHTFHPAYRSICTAMRAKAVQIESLSGGWGPFRAEYGSLWDWGAHDVAMALALVGEHPSQIRALRIDSRQVAAAVGERFRLDLRFPSGSFAVLEFGNIMPEKTRRFVVSDGHRRLLYDDSKPPCLFEVDSSYSVHDAVARHVRPLSCSEELPLTVAMLEFCGRIIRSDRSPDNVELGQHVVEVLAEADRQVGLPQPP